MILFSLLFPTGSQLGKKSSKRVLSKEVCRESRKFVQENIRAYEDTGAWTKDVGADMPEEVIALHQVISITLLSLLTVLL